MAKCHYISHGVLLPEIPQDVLAEYPYCWIRKDGDNSKYNLVFSKTKWYYNNGLSKGTSDNIPYYSITFSECDTAEEWTNVEYSANSFGISATRTVIWSNHDIPNGSATSTSIYFHRSEPILKSVDTKYVIGDTTLTAFADQARRISGETEELSIEQMITIFSNASEGDGSTPLLQDKTVTENGEVTADEGYDGLGKVTVNVPSNGGITEEEVQAMINAELEAVANGSY